MFYNYILYSPKQDEMYVGVTEDLKRRFSEHNNGKVPSTKRYMPWLLIYYEGCLNKKDAKRREMYLKTSQGRRMLKLRLKEYLNERKENLSK